MKLGFHLIGARFETTWVPGAFQLWVRGSQRALPHLGGEREHVAVVLREGKLLPRRVAAQVAHMKANFETRMSLDRFEG